VHASGYHVLRIGHLEERVLIEIEAEIAGNVWKIEKAVGDRVSEEDVLLILESMKMEIPVESPEDGTVTVLQVGEGDQVSEDDPVATMETA